MSKLVCMLNLALAIILFISCQKEEPLELSSGLYQKNQYYLTNDSIMLSKDSLSAGKELFERPSIKGSVSIVINQKDSFQIIPYYDHNYNFSYAKVSSSSNNTYFELDFYLINNFRIKFYISSLESIVYKHSLGFIYFNNDWTQCYYRNDVSFSDYSAGTLAHYSQCANRQTFTSITPYYLNIKSIDYENNLLSGDFWFQGCINNSDVFKQVEVQGSFVNLAIKK